MSGRSGMGGHCAALPLVILFLCRWQNSFHSAYLSNVRQSGPFTHIFHPFRGMILSCRPYYSEIEGGCTGHDGNTSAYEKVLYPYHICQGAEYHHANGKGTGGGNLHETEHPSLHGSRNLFLDGDRDRGVVTGGCDSNHQIACQVKQEYRSHSKACHQHTVQPSGQDRCF